MFEIEEALCVRPPWSSCVFLGVWITRNVHIISVVAASPEPAAHTQGCLILEIEAKIMFLVKALCSRHQEKTH